MCAANILMRERESERETVTMYIETTICVCV